MSLALGFCLFAYRPYGGLQRDFLRIAQSCLARGHRIQVWTMEWRGPRPEGIEVEVIPARRIRNHARAVAFAKEVCKRGDNVDLVVGFNKIPGLDVYFAADPCYEEKIRRMRSAWFRLSARYRSFAASERSVFQTSAKTQIMMLTEKEQSNYQRHYGTPSERFHLLPPGISQQHRLAGDTAGLRKKTRAEFGCTDRDFILLMVGSGFRTKGVDRSIRALAALPEQLRTHTRLLVVGEDNRKPFERLARKLAVSGQVLFTGGRSDIPALMLGADLLIHPAYSENTGTVILEAIVAGLPVLATETCGYAPHILEAGAGKVAGAPFTQEELNQLLLEMNNREKREQWSERGKQYGAVQDLYSMPERAADIIEHCAGVRPC